MFTAVASPSRGIRNRMVSLDRPHRSRQNRCHIFSTTNFTHSPAVLNPNFVTPSREHSISNGSTARYGTRRSERI